MVQPTILEKLEKLPESLQVEALHYIEFLLEKHLKGRIAPLKELAGEESQYGYGSMMGKIIISDDFDEPLEELAEYM